MGGKSSYQRAMALIALMAQIGSYVPAESATIGIFDGIYTRMGADDSINKGMSTFLVELAEAGNILRNATSRSLVLLDELGRGTSTHDGMAIAMATIEYIAATIKCRTLFTTHYLPLTRLGARHPLMIRNCYMSFRLSKHEDQDDCKGSDRVTFLYKMENGVCPNSYGLNVARLADVPEGIIRRASEKAISLRKEMRARLGLTNSFEVVARILNARSQDDIGFIEDIQGLLVSP
mmetsp:Transcript_19375/g.37433  ORF Transcript_19375/g.37433 Transcript_19375/m.37433 type:complete len:234 (-) Transcript_19375:55-756(-)